MICTGIHKTFDFDGDGIFTTNDASRIDVLISKETNLPKYYVKGEDEESYYPVLILLDENGNLINEEAKKYIAYDIDRNGYIDKNDSQYLKYADVSNKVY